MRTIELARKLAEHGQKEDAQKGYVLALQEASTLAPKEELEAASYLLFSKWDHRVPLSTFISLYNRGLFQEELMNLMIQSFYLPNAQKQQKQYTRNCRALNRYPYCFRKDFLPFEELPILFFPFDNQGFVPYYKAENRFGEYVNFDDPVIDRYFFKDLENPILAEDVYSQYQLEYLNDSVRKSEWVGRENHIYLHYNDWAQFCALLQCLDFMPLLKEEKFIFLIEEEIVSYPIDFKERFGIDYSQYPVRPVGIREVNRMIWHAQLSTHVGGDFFNEIFYDHPNLLVFDSVMFHKIKDIIRTEQQRLSKLSIQDKTNSRVVRELARIPHPTEKDFLVALFLDSQNVSGDGKGDARIAPVLFFQPHFENMLYTILESEKGDRAALNSEQYEEIRKSALFNQFKYIKTFTPMRRPTSSYGATVRFMLNEIETAENGEVFTDVFTERILNRSIMADRWDRLYRDSMLVRFEDGKLNPKATFTALAEFLDIPYTQTMTYCSGRTGLNPESMDGNDLGFDPAAIYRTYDEYVNDDDRCLLEYFLRDIYQEYGYDLHYYHGEPVELEWVKEKLQGFHHLDEYIEKTHLASAEQKLENGSFIVGDTAYNSKEEAPQAAEKWVDQIKQERLRVVELLMKQPTFINTDNQPLHYMKQLKLDPDLLEQPLYH